MNTTLKIDPEFKALCPPLADEEYEQLEENILTEGVIYTPLIVWDDIVIDGHNRYKIAQAHPDISFKTYEKQFENRYDALSWICKNQLGQRNLTPQQKMYLIGQRYEAEKRAHGGAHEKKPSDNSCHLESENRTRKKVAEEAGISEGSVQNAHGYARGVDAAEKVLPGIKEELLSGFIRPSAKEVAAIAKAASEERRQKAEELRIPKEKPEKSRAERRQDLEMIRAIGDEMRIDDDGTTSTDSMLETLEGVVADMIHVCDTLFMDFPLLLEDRDNKAKVIGIMQAAKQYVLQLEQHDAPSKRT